MGKQKNIARGGANAQKGASPTLLSHGGETGDTGEAVHNLRDDVAWLEEGLSQMGTPSKMPFRFTQSSQLSSKQPLSPEHWQDHPHTKIGHATASTPEWLWGKGRWPAPNFPYMEWFILCWCLFQDGLVEQIMEAVVLALVEAILFFGWWSLKEGIPLGSTRDVGFSLTGPVNWVSRITQVEVTVNTIQAGCQAILDAVV